MEGLIPIVNKLQDVFNAIGQNSIDLPQIVALGSQSSGKSSVVESIVGRDFLPRGTGIVTRRPLVLQLYNVKREIGREDSAGPQPGEEWGEFLHLPDQKFFSFEEIREEITRETNRVTGCNKGISNRSINLKIYSPFVLNLTLVDLPGITKVSVGDQPVDIEEQIRAMCLNFISNPNCIILSITAANSDLANSDALKLAKQVDPEGYRTIGVLTKIDLMDPGTDAMDMLNGRIIPLHRGFVGVVNRGQRDIDDQMSVRAAFKKERDFFASTSPYRSIAQRLGTPFLTKTLNKILMLHIRDCLPEIKSQISGMMVELQSELDSLGDSTEEQSFGSLGGQLLTLLSKFAQNFGNAIDGRSNGSVMELHELYGGARIAYIFNEIFAKRLKALSPFDGLTDDDIRIAIRNANGPRASLFVPEVSFELLAKRQIARLELPGLQCVDLVLDELQRMCAQSETPELTRFPQLRDRVIDVVSALLRACLVPTQSMISNLIRLELSYINTSHPDFIGGSRAVAQLMGRVQTDSGAPGQQQQQQQQMAKQLDIKGKQALQQQMQQPQQLQHQQDVNGSEDEKSGFISFIFGRKGVDGQAGQGQVEGKGVEVGAGAAPPRLVKLPQVPETMRSQIDSASDREKIETQIIKSLLSSYFDIVRKNFLDMVPKTIMYFLVNHTREHLQNELVSQLYRDDEMMREMMQEADDVAQRRANCKQMRALLQRAMEIVNEVRDFNTFK